MASETTTAPSNDARASEGRCDIGREELALVVVWSSSPACVGDVLLVPPGDPWSLGRGDDDGPRRLRPIRQRPQANERRPAIDQPSISRRQATVRVDDDALVVENVGRAPMIDPHGARASAARVKVGETIGFEKMIVFACVRRPERIARPHSLAAGEHPAFGEADKAGIVGESKAAWEFRDSLAFLAARTAHVLLLGPSGAGKELAARCIHELSARRARKLVSRNAATFPETLVEAELFGTALNYPNQGMAERPGMVGEAEGSTLFLDEIGELPRELQTRLLRLLDDPGEYQRLGDARSRRANVRVVAATNRSVSSLAEDLAARFKLRLSLIGLGERREDIPLLARHLLQRIAVTDPDIGSRFLEGWNGRTGEPRFAMDLMSRLVAHPYKTHVRELERLLWRSLATSRAGTIELTDDLRAELEDEGALPARVPGADEVRAALERAGGVKDRAWRELGLANRWVLGRLLKKYAIE